MTKELAQYRELERRLWMTRWMHEGRESAGEDVILDQMENVWMNLLDEERDLLRREGPICWPMEPSSPPPSLSEMLYSSAPESWPYEGFHTPLEAIVSVDAA